MARERKQAEAQLVDEAKRADAADEACREALRQVQEAADLVALAPSLIDESSRECRSVLSAQWEQMCSHSGPVPVCAVLL